MTKFAREIFCVSENSSLTTFRGKARTCIRVIIADDPFVDLTRKVYTFIIDEASSLVIVFEFPISAFNVFVVRVHFPRARARFLPRVGFSEWSFRVFRRSLLCTFRCNELLIIYYAP